MGHVRNYAIGDALARYMWMQGHNVLHPMGWDAFGLPAENAALKNNTPPRQWTLQNIAAMQRQMNRLGLSYDWRNEVTTCLPDYYRWNQWFFLKMYERGLAYRKKSKVNWCPQCATVLANEQVVDGCCWRHEEQIVEQRDLEQWFLRITNYAQELLDDLAKLEGWPEKVRTMQRNWIGRSEGAEVEFELEDDADATEDEEKARKSGTAILPAREGVKGSGKKIAVFTTRIDTIYGATSLQLAPEHPLVKEMAAEDARLSDEVAALLEQQRKAREAGDVGAIEKHGAFTGHYAINPFNGERLPVWVGNYILLDYGTGAIMSVPAHDERDFEFAKKYGTGAADRDPAAQSRRDRGQWRSREAVAVYGRGQPADQFRRVQLAGQRGSAAQDGGVRGGARIWQGDGYISAEGLGHQPAALLGHADSDAVLREGRHRAGAGQRIAGAAAGQHRDHAAGRIAAGEDAGVCERDVSEMRRQGAARDGHDGHVRRFVLVLLSLHGREERQGAICNRRRWRIGSRSTSTSAAWSTRSCT